MQFHISPMQKKYQRVHTPLMPEDGIWDLPPGTAQIVGEGYKCLICEKSFEQSSYFSRVRG